MKNLNPLLEISLGKPGIKSTWNGIKNCMTGGRHSKKYGIRETIQKVKNNLDGEQRKISKAASESAISNAIKKEAHKNPLGELGANAEVRSDFKKNIQKWARNAKDEAKKESDKFREKVDSHLSKLRSKK